MAGIPVTARRDAVTLNQWAICYNAGRRIHAKKNIFFFEIKLEINHLPDLQYTINSTFVNVSPKTFIKSLQDQQLSLYEALEICDDSNYNSEGFFSQWLVFKCNRYKTQKSPSSHCYLNSNWLRVPLYCSVGIFYLLLENLELWTAYLQTHKPQSFAMKLIKVLLRNPASS